MMAFFGSIDPTVQFYASFSIRPLRTLPTVEHDK